MVSPITGQNFNTQLRSSTGHKWCGTNESNAASFVGSGRVMGISRKDWRPRGSLRGFFLRKPLSRASQKHDMYPLERRGCWRSLYKGHVATATDNVHLASTRRRSPGQGTGTWISEEPQMTLTYRGQKYDQQKVAGSSNKPALTYRGVSYAKWFRLNQKILNPCLWRGFFLAASVAESIQAAPSTGRAHKPATWSGKGLQRPREELAPPERCGVCMHKLVVIQSYASFALTLFRIPLHRTLSPAIAHAGDVFCQLSDRSTEAVACGWTPHVRAQQLWDQAACSATRLLVIFGFLKISR